MDLQNQVPCISKYLKPGACRPLAGVPGFFKLLLSRKLVCTFVFVCVHPRAIKKHSHE